MSPIKKRTQMPLSKTTSSVNELPYPYIQIHHKKIFSSTSWIYSTNKSDYTTSQLKGLRGLWTTFSKSGSVESKKVQATWQKEPRHIEDQEMLTSRIIDIVIQLSIYKQTLIMYNNGSKFNHSIHSLGEVYN